MINRTRLHWRPRGRSRLVTRIARIRGIDMVGALAGRNRTIVTTDTRANDFVMVHCITRHGLPGCWARLMTRITGITGINMVGALARGDDTIMATNTGTDDLRMINGSAVYRRPGRRTGLVACVAGIGGIDMIGALAGCRNTIVTTNAGAVHLRVING